MYMQIQFENPVMTDSALKKKTKQDLLAEVKTLQQRLHKLETAFFDEQQWLTAITELSDDAIIRKSLDGTILSWNEGAEKLYGYTAAEALGKPVTLLLPPDAGDEVTMLMNRVRQGEIIRNFETKRLKKDGSQVIVSLTLSPLKDRQSNIIGALTVDRDITAARQIEDALGLSETRFRLLVDNSPVGIYMTDHNFHIVYANQNLADMIGYTIDELKAIDFRSFIAKEDVGRLVDSYLRRRQGEDIPNEFEFTGIRKDGEKRRLVVYVASTLFPDGYIRSWGQILDVTESRQAQEALAKERNLLRKVIDILPDNIFVKDTEGHFLLNNAVSMEILGVSRQEDLYGKTDFDLLPYHHAQESREDELEVLESGQSVFEQEVFVPENTDKWRWLVYSTVPLHNEQGEIVGLVGMNHDITELKLAGEALRASEERLRLVTDNIRDMIMQADETGIIRYVSPSSREVWGIPPEAMVGTHLEKWLERIHPDDREVTSENLRTRLATGEGPNLWPYRFIQPSGEMRWKEHVVSSFHREDGSLAGFVYTIRDITERKQVEEELEHHQQHLEEIVEQRTAELREANQQLIALSRVKDEFVSNVSHELRTPITSLTIRQHLMRKNPERLTYHLEVMERETDRLRRTIEDLLQLSRLDQKQTQLNLIPVDINTVVKRYVSDRRAIAESRNLSMAFDESPDLPGIPADEGLLEQALGILITNAINYTPSGGHISVKTIMQNLGNDSWVGFSVSDNGPGIAPQDQPRLFERFFRGETGRASGAAGTGLGLAIAKEIIERHSGKIEVESSGVKGEGARFTVLLPE
jgi:PAS domain S-box-containing protein